MTMVLPEDAVILLVEDDPGDALMVREALGETPWAGSLVVVEDGEDALRYLRRQEPFEDAVRPSLVLLDLNLPRVGGRQVLDEVKSDQSLRRIPIVVLTTSGNVDDVLDSYDRHANAYVTKPADFDAFVEAIRQIDDFYLTLVQLPE